MSSYNIAQVLWKKKTALWLLYLWKDKDKRPFTLLFYLTEKVSKLVLGDQEKSFPEEMTSKLTVLSSNKESFYLVICLFRFDLEICLFSHLGE